MLEVLSNNRNLKADLEEAQTMLRMQLNELPSYEIGKKQNLEQGQKQSRMTIAANLLDKMTDAEIAEIVGLPVNTVKELRQSRHNA